MEVYARCSNINWILIIILISCHPGYGQTGAPLPVYPIPSPQQLAWHRMEMNAFIHISINTFTDQEWGYGNEPAMVFNPTAADPDQWAKALSENHFKGIILTAKHHDGFCLWPDENTEYSIRNSPYKDGKGDLVKETADAAAKYGMKFGIYLSPWDRNRGDYGSKSYIKYYRKQLKTLLTNYGPVFEMWFDGANGGDGYYGGKNTNVYVNKQRYYNWPKTIKTAEKLQPDILFFSDAGPDIRWVGNEKGQAGITNWNTINNDTLYAGKEGINAILASGSPDGKKWIPAEVDVSIRPGWFYHDKENSKVKSPEQLFDIYLTSVGRGAVLLLNVPPDKNGLINDADLIALKGFSRLLKQRLGKNLAKNATVTASNVRGGAMEYAPERMLDDDMDSYWCTDDGVTSASFDISLDQNQMVKYVLVQEYIPLGQRVKSFEIEALDGDQWKVVGQGTTIGYKRIIEIPETITSKLRIWIKDAKACPLISNVQVY